jgi:hypothetical protein
MAQQGIDRSTQAALGAAQGAGVEGVIGAAGNIVGAAGEAEMGLAAQAGEAKLNRDMAQATAGANIEMRRGERESAMYQAELTGAQQAKSAAETAKTEAIAGAVGSLGSAAGSFGGLIGPGYGKKKGAVASDALSTTYKKPKANYTGSVTGDNGTEVDTSAFTPPQWY